MPYNDRCNSSAKRALLRGVATLLSLAALLFVGFDTPRVPPDDAVANTEAEPRAVLADANGVMFVLRCVDGRVAVLNPLETAVLEVLDIDVSELPEQYKDELEGGVIVGSVTARVDLRCRYGALT